jgi:hypothetical protein
MNRLLLAVALAVVCAVPCRPHQIRRKPKQGTHPRSRLRSVYRKRWVDLTEAIPTTPIGDPCLSYYRSWGPGACGR